jgi:isopenicillin N synthase-like dioxygenase
MLVIRNIPKTGVLAQKAARMFSSTPKIVQMDFKEIINQENGLFDKFEEAYGEEGVGAMVVNNIPKFPEKRKKLLPYAQKLAKLDNDILEELETPEYFYSVGWSHGREKFRGKPDLLKGSYYACPITDRFKMILADGEETYFNNKWPKKGVIDGFEDAFKDLGQFINSVGIEVGKNLDKYIKHRCDKYQDGLIERHLKESTRTTGRLLHYFPVDKEIDTTDMKWCGWHNDHGTLTGLCSAMYLDKDFKEVHPSDIEDDVSGLFAMTRDHQEIKIRIPQNSLAFQIGETAQIISGGLLCATPHSVVCKPNTDGISRNTFALFMEPNPHENLFVPEGVNPKNVYRKDPTKQVPEIDQRWKEGFNFSQFENKTFQLYYEFQK